MLDDVALSWTLTIVFTITGGYYLCTLLRRGRRTPAATTDDGLHVMMSVAMIAMVWPIGLTVPVMVYVTMFTAAALWFAARALFTGSPGTIGAGDPATVSAHHGSRPIAWYHAAMMASMVFMAICMNGAMSTMAATASATGSGSTMADMSGTATAITTTATAGDRLVSRDPTSWVWIGSLLLAAAFLLAATWLARVGLRGRTRHTLVAGGAGGLMAVGMAVMFAELI